MTLEEAAKIARCSSSSDSVESKHRWECLTIAFPEHDWRTHFIAAAKEQAHYWSMEVDMWESPFAGEARLIAELRAENIQLQKLRKPMTISEKEEPF